MAESEELKADVWREGDDLIVEVRPECRDKAGLTRIACQFPCTTRDQASPSPPPEPEPALEPEAEPEPRLAPATLREHEEGLARLQDRLPHAEKRVLSAETQQKLRVALLDILRKRCSLTDLRLVCFHLGEPWEEIAGTGLSCRAMSLLEYIQQRGRLADVVTAGRHARPDIDWPGIP